MDDIEDIIDKIPEDDEDEPEYNCLECLDTGEVMDEDGFAVRCPYCNPKLSVDEQMDDDS